MKKSGGIIASTVRALAEPIARDLGYELWDVEYVKEGADYYLRIEIDSERGITLDDCEKMHRAIDPVLDEADPIDRAYYLEVSSPGLGRQIKNAEQAEKMLGQKVEARFFAPDAKGRKAVVGQLSAYGDKTAKLAIDGEDLEIELKTIAKLCLCDYECTTY